jgi:2,4-dienoyl-CoA reductase-like NADH-dependent reductase (Old Yellow Enzyme family)
LHIVHTGDEQLVGDMRARWKQALIVNRPSRARDQIGTDVASGLADLEAYGQMVLANPDFVARVKTTAPMNEADRASFFGGAAQGWSVRATLASGSSRSSFSTTLTPSRRRHQSSAFIPIRELQL